MTDRGPNGKFIKGNKASPGRPTRATDAEYLDALKSTLPIDRFQRIVDSYAKRAEKGDTRAAEVLFKYVLPQVQKQEHNGIISLRVIYDIPRPRQEDDNA